MILSLILIFVVIIVAYWHYTQGLFSAIISATLTTLGAVYALAYHEAIAGGLMAGKYPDVAPAAVLVVLFAAIYVLGRVLFDKLVPGNVRIPNTVDRAGGAAVGLVAGVMVAGVLGVAAQILPFGPSIAGYSRYPLTTRTDVDVPRSNNRQTVILEVPDELRVDEFDPARGQTLLLPVDDILVGLVDHLSGTGSLSGPVVFAAAQPDYLDTLFGQRLGVQAGAKRSAVNAGVVEQVTVPDDGVATYARLPQVPGELDAIRPASEVPARRDPAEGDVLLAVRIDVGQDASDSDNVFRFSPAAVRLVAAGDATGDATGTEPPADYRPVGTLAQGAVLVANKLDDPLFLSIAGEGGVVDLVFEVPADLVKGAGSDAATIADGVFLEVKRFARVDLSGHPVVARLQPDPTAGPMRKPAVEEFISKAFSAPATPADAPAAGPADASAPADAKAGPA